MKTTIIKWQLIVYDLIIFLFADLYLFYAYRGHESISLNGFIIQSLISLLFLFGARLIGKIYKQIWRYGGIQCYVRLLIVDACAFIANVTTVELLPFDHFHFEQILGAACINLLCALAIRMFYRFLFKCGNSYTKYGKFFRFILKIFAGTNVQCKPKNDSQRIRIAIIGAGKTGVSLAEELLSNTSALYIPVCFIDNDKNKVGRNIHDIPVLMENDSIFELLKRFNVQEIVFAIHKLDPERKNVLYRKYLDAEYKIKIYDFPEMHIAGGKRYMRDFDVEELLFRKPVVMYDEKTNEYYKNKIILITGGGGSIGSEICKQLAKMEPREIIILDIYENGAYDVQQELKIAYGNNLSVNVEICSITNSKGMARIFEKYHPQIIINVAAHKHVPLMENNCIEAIENNVFGTKVLVELCEEYHAERFMMVSTDKAVNPTNVMGATKRMCEMIIQSASIYGDVKYSATRFGNVLGSAGSVIPLFKKQIANGGPITITDKRIIRYFMTIPEAAQLVLQSGAMANNGEIFVLDMGESVKILDLAQNMIRLSGVSDIEIVETGLRPGEKLYEELLVKTEELDKTENSLIYIERDTPLCKEIIDEKLERLKKACLSEDEEIARTTLKSVVPSFISPEIVNAKAEKSNEMQNSISVAAL